MTAPYKESSRDDPAECKCGRPLAGDNDTGVCYECARQRGQSMRCVFQTKWDQERGYRVVNTSDGGVVYGGLGSSRDADIVTRLLNEKAALFAEVAALREERDALLLKLHKEVERSGFSSVERRNEPMTLLEACKVALDALGCDRTRQDRLEAQRIIHTAIKKAEREQDERDAVKDCPHGVLQGNVYVDNPHCAACEAKCVEYCPF